MTINALVADDSRLIRKMIIRHLEGAGLGDFQFVEAADGVEALEKFKSGDIHIVFVDWNMPRLTGAEFVRQARTLDADRNIPIVMVTSEIAPHKIEAAFKEIGVSLYITKPFTAEDLIQCLEGLFAETAK